MFDPFGSFQNMLGSFQQFMGNPFQFMLKNKLNIPQEYMNDPNQAIQYLMNQGKLTQEQYNWALQQSKQIQNNPQFANFVQRFNSGNNPAGIANTTPTNQK